MLVIEYLAEISFCMYTRMCRLQIIYSVILLTADRLT